MPVDIRNSRISGSKTGVRTEGKVDLVVDSLSIDSTDTAYDIAERARRHKATDGSTIVKAWHERAIGKVTIGLVVVVLGAILLGASKYFLGVS